MLQFTEMSTLDNVLPTTDAAATLLPQGSQTAPSGSHGFAEMLMAKTPVDSADLAMDLPTGEALPESGKDLPVRAMPVPSVEVEALPLVEGMADLSAEMPGLAVPVDQVAPAIPQSVVPDTDTTRANADDGELAALQRMLAVNIPPVSTTPAPQAAEPVVASGLVAAIPNPLRDARSLAAGGRSSSVTQLTAVNSRQAAQQTDSSVMPVTSAAAEFPGPLADLSQTLRQTGAPLAVDVPGVATSTADQRAGEAMLAAGDIRLESLEPLQRPLPMPAAPLTATTPAAAPPTTALPIDVPVTDTRWGEALGERVMWMTGQKLGSAEIRLNPQELGPVKIEIKLDDNQAQVHFTAQHAATREAIEQALPRLRELLQSEGLNLANTNVSDDGVQQQQDGRGESARSAPDRLLAGDNDGDDADQHGVLAQRLGDGLIDTFA